MTKTSNSKEIDYEALKKYLQTELHRQRKVNESISAYFFKKKTVYEVTQWDGTKKYFEESH